MLLQGIKMCASSSEVTILIARAINDITTQAAQVTVLHLTPPEKNISLGQTLIWELEQLSHDPFCHCHKGETPLAERRGKKK